MPNQELSLIPADSSSQQFSTKGSVDWVGLGRMQFSASVAVLGRLSAAGVEPLTVAVGQAMCSGIPLGVHGEKVLMEAMSKLKAFSSAGDLIWFGVGVRHILRTLVQTSQGASLVALCAALAEGHSTHTAALIVFEMSKLLGSPEDLRPSYNQWLALVKVCSSVFAVTTFGVRLQQLLNLCGPEYQSRSSPTSGEDYGAPPYPPEFAKAVLGIGKVSSGALRDVELTGEACCAWLAVFAEYILGLRVQVRKDSGQLLTMNHNTDLRSQVVVVLCHPTTGYSALRCTGQSYTVSSGADFIQQFFQGVHMGSLLEQNEHVWGGRVPWQSMLRDVFGDVVDDLLKPVEERQWVSKMLPSSINADGLRQDAFLTLLVYAAEAIVSSSPATTCADAFSFLQQIPTKLPELTPIRHRLLKKGFEFQQLHDAIEVGHSSGSVRKVHEAARREGYQAARCDLERYCDCQSHTKPPHVSGRVTKYCIVEIAQLIIVLICMLEHLDLDSPILPQRHGIIKLMRRPFTDLDSEWITGQWGGKIDQRLTAYHCLFSNGRDRVTYAGTGTESMCAFGEGAVYCYVDTLVNVTDKVEQAYRVHVGAGTINRGSQIHDRIFDTRSFLGIYMFWLSDYPAERFEFDHSDANLFGDTTSPSLRMEPVVNEGINISFWYELSNGKFHTQVSPNVLAWTLFTASLHRVLMRSNGNWQTPVQLIEHKQLRVIGEGRCHNVDPDDYTFNIMLRPHHGNLLGRIVSLIGSHRSHTIFLVDDKEDLARAKHWIKDVMSESPSQHGIYCFIS